MAKLTKRQNKKHLEALALLEKSELLTTDEKEFVFKNYHQAADGDVTYSGAFFTPLDLAFDFALETSGPKIIDLCAGIGALSYAAYNRGRYHDERPQITSVEINPRYVEIGKKLLPEATWICADITSVWCELGCFDYAISNPPFGRIKKNNEKAPLYKGREFEYIIADIASHMARHGAFIFPQTSAPFRLSGVQCYERNENAKYKTFAEQTGLFMEAGCGVDTSFYINEWNQRPPVTEIVCCDFEERTPPAQGDLFAEAA
ncbi:MAG: methyltransferase [Pseudomonadota bacterium]